MIIEKNPIFQQAYFVNSIDEAAKNGISCVIQPGGSIRDEEVISAADEADMIMIFTGMRHFRH